MTRGLSETRRDDADWLALFQLVSKVAAESRRREAPEFDGLLGRLPPDSAGLLQRAVARIRDYLLARYGEEDARAAVRAHLTPRGFPAGSAAESVLLDIFADIATAASATVEKSDRGHEAAALAEVAGLDRETLLFGNAGRAIRRGRQAGGKSRGEAASTKAEARHAKWCAEGRKMRQAGTAAHDIASILARRMQVSDRTMRTALVTGGVISGRKNTEVS